MGTTNNSSDSSRIGTYFAIGIGVIGAILLVLGILLSVYGFSSGIWLAVFGLITLIVVLIVYVLETDGADTEVGAFSGPKLPSS